MILYICMIAYIYILYILIFSPILPPTHFVFAVAALWAPVFSVFITFRLVQVLCEGSTQIARWHCNQQKW